MTWVHTLACMQKLEGSGGMFPQENFFEFRMLWDGFWSYYWAKTSLLIFVMSWHGNRILNHFTSARMKIEVSIDASSALKMTQRSDARKPVKILLSIYMYCWFHVLLNMRDRDRITPSWYSSWKMCRSKIGCGVTMAQLWFFGGAQFSRELARLYDLHVAYRHCWEVVHLFGQHRMAFASCQA